MTESVRYAMNFETTDLSIKLYQSIKEDNESRVFEHWHCSSIAECPRAHYFKRKGVAALNQPTASKVLRWQSGHIIEGFIRPYLEKLYPDLISNKRFTSEKLDLTGEFDNYSEKEKMLIEIKSVHDGAMRYITNEGPYLNHLYQNHAYKLLLDENNMPVEKITFVYISLSGLIQTFLVPISQDILTNVEKRLELLENASDEKLPPCWCNQKDHPLYSSTMRWCDYKDEAKDTCCDRRLLSEAL